MKRGQVVLVCAVALAVAAGVWRQNASGATAIDAEGAPAVLSVALTQASTSMQVRRIAATGIVAPWQEASVGFEGDALRLTQVHVNVGDVVKRGQVLATFKTDVLEADLAEARAATAQADAEMREAQANAARVEGLDKAGAMSRREASQYRVAAVTAKARLDAARAVTARQTLRLAQARVLAPSDGVITSRTATVGAVVASGQELFRLIQDGRLEWRALVATADLPLLAPAQRALLTIEGHAEVQGAVRILAPMIDTQTYSGMAYVDVPASAGLRAGAFARGYIEAGHAAMLTVPQSAVLLRNGFSYVMRVDEGSKIVMDKVTVGRRSGDRVEIREGLSPADAIVAAGLGFLNEGDVVRVVPAGESL